MIKDPLLSWRWWLEGGWLVAVTKVTLALIILIVAFTAARFVRAALDRLKGRPHLSAPVIYIFQKLSSYALVAVGVLIALSTVGIDLTSLAVFAGAVGVGVGLGPAGYRARVRLGLGGDLRPAPACRRLHRTRGRSER